MTQRILHVIPSLHYHGAATQLALLASHLPRERFDVRVCVLGPDGPVATALKQGGIACAALGWTRLVDPLPFWRLRQHVREFQPSIIHTWDLVGLRAAYLATLRLKRRGPIVANIAGAMTRASVFNRWLLNRAARIVVNNSPLAEGWRQGGFPSEQITVIPPAVATARDTAKTRAELLLEAGLSIAAEARFIVCIGPIESAKGFRDAVWAFDILKYLYSDLHLLIAGAGSEVERLRQFIRSIGATEHAHLVGPQADARALLSLAEVVWVPSRTGGGVNVALEAQAAGKPVVASRLPELAEVVSDIETGYLVAPGDKVSLARQTRVLLEDDDRRRRFGTTGRERAAAHFNATDMANRFAQVYELIH